jgi:hypothetical protein
VFGNTGGRVSAGSKLLVHHGEEVDIEVAMTIPVTVELATADPAELLAVTETRIVNPTSADPRR